MYITEGFSALSEEEQRSYETKYKEMTDAGKTGEDAIAELLKIKDSIKKIDLIQLIETVELALSEGKTPLVN